FFSPCDLLFLMSLLSLLCSSHSCFSSYRHFPDLHSFPTRRSSDLSVLVIRLRSLRLLRVSGIVMRLRMFLLLITFLKASHSFRNRLLVICKNAYLFATMIMTSVSSPFSCCSGIVR